MKIPFKRTKAKLYLAGWSLVTATFLTLIVTFLTADVKPSFFDSGIMTREYVGQDILGTDDAQYHVIKIVDGDTIRVEKDGVSQTVRLIGIDTPESVDPRKSVECFAHEASARLEELIGDRYVRLEADLSQADVDRYGRVLRYVLSADRTLVNKLMIQEGFAYEYTYDKPYQYQDDFKSAQRDAEAQGLGLWNPATCGGGR